MTAQEIKLWLKHRKKTHAWLAGQLGVTVHSVNGWLSSGKKITPARLAHIAEVMKNHDLAGQAEGICAAETPGDLDRDRDRVDSITLFIDSATFDLWNQAALASGLILRDWATNALTEAAENGLRD